MTIERKQQNWLENKQRRDEALRNRKLLKNEFQILTSNQYQKKMQLRDQLTRSTEQKLVKMEQRESELLEKLKLTQTKQ